MLRDDRGRPLQGLRVLLVEDADDIRDVLTLLLAIDGADVRAAATAHAALEIAAGWDFDVLLTDIGLPDVSGDRLIHEILGMKPTQPRVVAVTGFGERHAELARRAGAETVLTKPIDWPTLLDQLGRALTVAA